MTIETLISEVTPPLKEDDSVEEALGILLESRVRHLPVVNHDGKLVGLMSEEQLLDAPGPEALIGTLITYNPVSVRPELHVFDATKVMVDHDLTVLPIAREDKTYLGLVKRHNILDLFARMLSTQESGAIIALEIDDRDYSLAKLAHLIEQNDVKILSTATESSEAAEGKMRVTLKLNVQDTSRIRHILEHHSYRVIAAFSSGEDEEDFQERLQEFMRYLEV